jgi:ATP-dependent Clp protease ATP-binding subunit ClpX
MKVEVMACDFCKKTQHQVEVLIAGPRAMICNECIDLCNEFVAKHRAEKVVENTQTQEGV